MNSRLIMLLLFCLAQQIFAQQNLLRDTATLNVLSEGVRNIYNYEFTKAEKISDRIDSLYAGHPVAPLYKAFIIYWKYNPLIPGRAGSDAFVNHLEYCIVLSETILEEDENDIEGVFFNMMARSFLAMYYADNGKSGKAIPHLPRIYRYLLKGFELKDEFDEFYFVTGLYNYYREAYPDAYPVYKPIAVFFHRGNKELGLTQLNYATEKTIFLSVEATLFLSLIYMNFENDADKATEYAKVLTSTYPANTYFIARYAEMLLYKKEYDLAKNHIDKLLELNDTYSIMKGFILKGIYEEKFNKNLKQARKDYLHGLELSEPYGHLANYYQAYAYMGLCRYHKHLGNKKKAKEYYKKARESIGYDYILKDL